MAFIEIEKGSPKDIGKRFQLGQNPVLIGRQTPQSTPDVPVNDDYVSRRHAQISFDSGLFVLRDLGSTNGTSIDDVRIEPDRPYPLRHDSAIGLGLASGHSRVLLRFRDSATVSTVRIEPDYVRQQIWPEWLRIDEEKGEVRADGKVLALSRKEHDLVVFLSSRTGKLCQRDELVSAIWPEVTGSEGVSDAAIDQLVHRLRLKVEPNPAQPARIISRKGFGYMMQ